jgi:hypothetical protein
VLVLALVILLAGVIVSAQILVKPVTDPPTTVTYTDTNFQAKNTTLCPGDILIYTVDRTFHDGGQLLAAHSFLDKKTDSWAILKNGLSAPDVPDLKPIPTHWIGRTNHIEVRIPVPDLPPGNYTLVTSAVGQTKSDPAAYNVDFRVPEGCQAK